MVRCFLTTFDNPYSPYDEFEKWYQYDVEHGYNSSGLLMRIAETSSQFTDNENAYEIEKAIDKIVAADPINIYKMAQAHKDWYYAMMSYIMGNNSDAEEESK